MSDPVNRILADIAARYAIDSILPPRVDEVLAAEIVTLRNTIAALHAENARRAWKLIDTAPQDRLVEVYAPSPDPARWHESVCDLPPVVCLAQWHPDAGFCVCTIREVTHWREHEPPAALAAKVTL